MATDFDCWHEGHDAVTVEAVIEVMNKNVAAAKQIIQKLAKNLPDASKSPASTALAGAIMTDLSTLTSAAAEKLQPVMGAYLP